MQAIPRWFAGEIRVRGESFFQDGVADRSRAARRPMVNIVLGSRTESQIRVAVEQANATEKAKAIVEVVKKLGLEPFRAPEPLTGINS